MSREGERGAAAAELVMVLPLVLFILGSMIEMALMLNAQLVLQAAARDGGRRAAVAGGSTAYVHERIAAQLTAGGLDPAQVDVYFSPWRAPFGHSIRLRLTYDYSLRLPALRPFAGRSVTLRAEVVTRSELLQAD